MQKSKSEGEPTPLNQPRMRERTVRSTRCHPPRPACPRDRWEEVLWLALHGHPWCGTHGHHGTLTLRSPR